MRAVGYYSPSINFFLCNQKKNNTNDSILNIYINPGIPIKTTAINIKLYGDAYKDEDYKKIITHSNFLLKKILNHSDYDNLKKNIFNIALQKGYFDAYFRKSHLNISLINHQAFWDIDFDSGKRYRFGKICFKGTQIHKNYLKNLSNINEGDNYSAEALMELYRRLIAINWFNSVLISPDFSHGKKEKILALDIAVIPRARNNFEVGIGYATNIGPRMQIILDKPWLNKLGHSFNSKLSFSILEQTANFNYKIPLITNPLEQFYLLQGKFKRNNFKNIQFNTATFKVVRYWELFKDWQQSINLRWSIDNFTQANVNNTFMLIYPGINTTKIKQDNNLMPTWSNKQYYSIDISNNIWGSNINFIILQMQNVWIRTLFNKHRFIIHNDLEYIKTNNFKQISSLIRIFSNNNYNVVRGYKHKSILLLNDNANFTGVLNSVIHSLEYQYNISKKWWNVLFVDCGEVVNNIKTINFKIGAGIGIRWQSPLGPIKLNIATPMINNNYKYGLQFYVGLGPEL